MKEIKRVPVFLKHSVDEFPSTTMSSRWVPVPRFCNFSTVIIMVDLIALSLATSQRRTTIIGNAGSLKNARLKNVGRKCNAGI